MVSSYDPMLFHRLSSGLSGFENYLNQGGDADSLEVSKAEWRNIPRSQRYREKRGNKFVYYRLPNQDDHYALAEKRRGMELDEKQSLFDAMDSIPYMKALKGEAMGEEGVFDLYDKAFSQVGKEALGAAAPSGLLRDQAPFLVADTAVRYADMARGIQNQARGAVGSYLGLPGMGGPAFSSGMGVAQMPSYADIYGSALNSSQNMIGRDWAMDDMASAKRSAMAGAGLGLLSSAAGAAFGYGGKFGQKV